MRTRKVRVGIALGALALAAAAVVACGGSGRTGAARSLTDLTLTTLDGAPVAGATLKGRPAVVNVWQQTCAPCKQEMPAIQQVHTEFGDRVRFVGVDSQDDPAKAKAFAQSIGVTYELWSDELGDVFAALDLSSIPTTLFLDATGRVVETHTGALNAAELRARVVALLGKAA